DLGGVRLTAGACRQLNVFGWDRKSTFAIEVHSSSMYMSGTAETVRYAPDRAKELLETGPREYDRLPDSRHYDGYP
ncbi:hypothetical protein, partial [Collinsella aerofaciens]|uniref:hypothetical protein n=1 Tax=Collinsella aerofaciens TaxID=74426 RepID=UPI003569A35B